MSKPTYDELFTLLCKNQDKWLDEEDSVQEEKAELIAENEAMIERIKNEK